MRNGNKRMNMRLIAPLIVAAFAVHAPAARAADAWLSMAYTNALSRELPFSIFTGEGWSPDPKARFVKLHLYFDEPIPVAGLEFDDCGSGIDPGISVFFNFDEWILSPETQSQNDVWPTYDRHKDGDLLVLDGFGHSVQTRSLTVNFENSTGFRICGITVRDPDGKPYAIKTPALVAGTVESDSVLAPASAYDPIFLFDSRFEYGWASNKQEKGVSLRFAFDQPRRIEKIRLWNGYQRSITHCAANSRARTIRITGDGNYSAEIAVADTLGSQIIDLPKPFMGRNLRFEIADSYPGKSYKDLVLSELRFFGDGEWFLLDPAPALKKAIAANRTAFAGAGTVALLNDSFLGRTEPEAEWFNAKLRLRADGSFYLSGSTEEDEPHEYFALGNYEIAKPKAGVEGQRLRLFGLYYETEIYGDCNGCGRDCNKADLPEGVTARDIFQEYVDIVPGTDGGFTLINESGGKKLKFKKFLLTREGGAP